MSKVQTKAEVLRRKPIEEHRTKVSISMNPTYLRLLDEQAEEMDVSRSLIVQLALREYFARER